MVTNNCTRRKGRKNDLAKALRSSVWWGSNPGCYSKDRVMSAEETRKDAAEEGCPAPGPELNLVKKVSRQQCYSTWSVRDNLVLQQWQTGVKCPTVLSVKAPHRASQRQGLKWECMFTEMSDGLLLKQRQINKKEVYSSIFYVTWKTSEWAYRRRRVHPWIG